MAQCQTDASVCRVCRYSGSDIRLKGCGCRVHAVSCLSENAFRPPWFRCCFSFLACRRPLPSLSVLLSVYLCIFRCSTRRLRLEGEKFFSIFGIFTIRTMAHSTRTGIPNIRDVDFRCPILQIIYAKEILTHKNASSSPVCRGSRLD